MGEENKMARRTFFAGIGIAAAAGAAAKLLPKTATPEVVSVDEQSQGDGYRLSEHIKKYYRTAII